MVDPRSMLLAVGSAVRFTSMVPTRTAQPDTDRLGSFVPFSTKARVESVDITKLPIERNG